ncbi:MULTISPECIES: phospho-sugar mutase [Fusobacterium]|uniref:phospho-sugar mutase n=1 Tax=Fusobacterium TaxID=848 RepID=UPI0014768B55|nr:MULTISPECIES: phospho-sugar mutase [Fusobacterium]NME35914.1 phospho-sugar mutase [Fusobacterium sp. FSA-380-WT-3A]
MDEKTLKGYNLWLNSPYIDEEDKKELRELEGNEKEIQERFYTNISFGTAGMRGVRGVGTNRINKYMVRKATQGLANYLIATTGEEGMKKGVAIAYDCRIGSYEYAVNSALVLAGNGIKSYLFESLRTTPELSFAVRELKAQAGIMVTASHNPQEYNGYKVYWDIGGQIVEPQASGIINAVNAIEDFAEIKMVTEEEAKAKGLLEIVGEKLDNRFIEEVKKEAIHVDIPGKKDYKIVYSPLHGTAGRPVKRILAEMGFESVYVVKEQEQPDGMFPTCSYANPEDTTVFALSTKLADEVGADLCIANDPDGDRTGIAVKTKEGKWFYPNGNQIGMLFMEYILKMTKPLPTNGAVVSTIVSTPILDEIGKAYGVKVYRTLTGFKYIGEKIEEFKNKVLDGTYLFGFEESIGYLKGTHVRDKDAVVASLLLAEIGAYYASQGTSIANEIEKIYEKYGWYGESTVSVTKKGMDGAKEIAHIMEQLREREITEILGKKVLTLKDFEKRVEINLEKCERKTIELPKSDVLQFILEDDIKITVRPSGTEPKIKYYIYVKADSKEKSEEKLEVVKEGFVKFVDSL